jgi:replicative DNA helicase
MAIKEIPSNMVAEQSVLGSMFLSTFALRKACDELQPDSFYYDNNSKIFSAMAELHNKGIPIDATTVTSELKNKGILSQVGGVEYLTEIFNIVPTAANVEQYIKLVEETALQRRLIEVSTDIATNAYDNSIDINTTLDEAERKILNVVNNRRTTEFRTIKEVTSSAKSNLEKLSTQDGDVTGLSTGWEKIDRITTGLHEGQLIIIAARPAVGKSAWALNLATNAAVNSNATVAIFNLEMSGESLVNRMISCLGHIEGYKLASGNLKNDWDKVNEAIAKLENTNIYIDDTAGNTVGEIRSKCRKLATSPHGLDIVVIDYLTLIQGSSKNGANRQQEVADISRALKTMAMELNVPVIALSQLSRGIEQRVDKKPMLSDLRESGAIEQDADIVAFLHCSDEEREKENSMMEFVIRKHRNGPLADVPLIFQRNTSTFVNVAPVKES